MPQDQARPVDKAAKVALRARLDELLTAMNVVTDWPDITQYELFATLLSVHGPWRLHLTVLDLLTIFSRAFRRRGIKAADGEPQKLVKLVDAETFNALRAEIEGYLVSLPRPYRLWVALPAMPRWGEGSIKFSDQMELVEREAPRPNHRGLLALALMGDPIATRRHEEGGTAVHLCVSATGYGSMNADSTAVADAVSQLKQFFQMFRRLRVFKQHHPLKFLMRGTPSIESWIEDAEYPDERITVHLPQVLATFLSTASLNEDELWVLDDDEQHGKRASTILTRGHRKPRTRKEWEFALAQSMSWVLRLMNCPQSEDIDRIRSAFEWAFDSDQGDNQTLSLLQACIGLEAMLGDDDKEEPLVARLKDRCAYLLGKNHSDREAIRKRFAAMYSVRSKVIHGRSRRLSMSDAEHLHYAQLLLGDVIAEEADRLLRNLKK